MSLGSSGGGPGVKQKGWNSGVGKKKKGRKRGTSWGGPGWTDLKVKGRRGKTVAHLGKK